MIPEGDAGSMAPRWRAGVTQRYESNCRVDVKMKLTGGMPTVLWSREIAWVETPLPDGDYTLSVGEKCSEVRLLRGFWLVLGY